MTNAQWDVRILVDLECPAWHTPYSLQDKEERQGVQSKFRIDGSQTYAFFFYPPPPNECIHGDGKKSRNKKQPHQNVQVY